MLFISTLTVEHVINAYFYLTFYNISLVVLFWLFLSVQVRELQSLYSLSHFRFNHFYLTLLVITIFSIAGIPPFVGFFTKVLVVLTILQQHFILTYWLVTPLLLLSLYFYIQNIRFIYTSGSNSFTYPYLENERVVLIFIYCTLVSLNLQICGFIWFDKFFIFFYWLLL